MISSIILAASVAVAAVFSGGQVTQDDLKADAFLQRAQRLDETLEQATEMAPVGSDAYTSAVRAIATTKILAAAAGERGFRADEAERNARDATRLIVLRKIFYLEQIAPRVRDARAVYLHQLQKAHAENPELCEVPGEYFFRYIFIGDPKSSTTPRWDDLETSALAVRKRLEAPGADFEKIARETSNSQPPENRGMLLGPVTSRGMESTRTQALEKAPLDGVSEPFKTNRGWMMVKMEKRTPQRMLSPEESSETLVMARKLRRFMPEAVETSVTLEAVGKYPLKIDEAALSSDPGAADKVVVESPLFTLKNGDIYDKVWKSVNPVPEPKDLLSGAGTVATRMTVARIAERDFVSRQQVYGDALKTIDEATAAAAEGTKKCRMGQGRSEAVCVVR